MKNAQAAVQEASAQMRSHLEGLSGAFELVKKAALGVTAILAGGAAFREIIESTVNWAEGALNLSRSLGVTTEKASVYQIALQHLGISSDVLVSASDKVSKNLYTNAAAFEKLGVHTKDANGQFRPTVDIIADVNSKLAAMPNVTARNIAAQQVYGRSWSQVRDLLRLTREEMEQAEAQGKSLGLVVGPEGAARAEQYKEGMNDLRLVGTALSSQIGNEMIPTLINVGRIFSESGPKDMHIFSTLLNGIAYTTGTVAIEFQKLGLWIGKVAAQAAAFMHGDFGAIGAIGKDFDNDLQALNKNADELWDKLNRPIPAQKSAEPAAAGGTTPFDSKEKSASRAGGWETTLQEKKAAYEEDAASHGQLLEFSKQQEVDYWKNILATTQVSEEERKSIQAKIAGDELSIDKQKLEGSLATLKNEESAHGKSLNDRLAAEMKYADTIKGVYGADSKQYADAQKAIVDTKRRIGDQVEQLDTMHSEQSRNRQLAEINSAENAAKTAYQNKQMSLAQITELEEQFEAQRYAIKQKALANELTLVDPSTDPVAYEKKVEQIQQLAEQHAAAMQQINDKAAVDQTKIWNGVFTEMGRGFDQTIANFLKGTTSIGQMIRGLFQDVASTVINTLAQMAAKNLEVMVQSMLMSKTAAMSQLKANAAAAAGAAYNAVVGIPYVGPFLAPAAAALAYSGVLAFGSDVASAEGGYDVPAGVNPMTQLHSKEMVLPQSVADPIRNMAAGGGSGGETHVHISAVDAQSFVKWSQQNSGAFAAAMKGVHDRFGLA